VAASTRSTAGGTGTSKTTRSTKTTTAQATKKVKETGEGEKPRTTARPEKARTPSTPRTLAHLEVDELIEWLVARGTRHPALLRDRLARLRRDAESVEDHDLRLALERGDRITGRVEEAE